MSTLTLTYDPGTAVTFTTAAPDGTGTIRGLPAPGQTQGPLLDGTTASLLLSVTNDLGTTLMTATPMVYSGTPGIWTLGGGLAAWFDGVRTVIATATVYAVSDTGHTNPLHQAVLRYEPPAF